MKEERLSALPEVTKPLSRTRIRILVAIIIFIVIMMIKISAFSALLSCTQKFLECTCPWAAPVHPGPGNRVSLTLTGAEGGWKPGLAFLAHFLVLPGADYSGMVRTGAVFTFRVFLVSKNETGPEPPASRSVSFRRGAPRQPPPAGESAFGHSYFPALVCDHSDTF